MLVIAVEFISQQDQFRMPKTIQPSFCEEGTLPGLDMPLNGRVNPKRQWSAALAAIDSGFKTLSIQTLPTGT
jgi:hypothetical protein